MTTLIKNRINEKDSLKVPARYRISKEALEGIIEFVSKERRPW